MYLLDHNKSPNRGRPPIGLAAKDHVYKVRLDSFTAQRLSAMSHTLGITKAEMIRQGVLLYLDQVEKTCLELKYR